MAKRKIIKVGTKSSAPKIKKPKPESKIWPVFVPEIKAEIKKETAEPSMGADNLEGCTRFKTEKEQLIFMTKKLIHIHSIIWGVGEFLVGDLLREVGTAILDKPKQRLKPTAPNNRKQPSPPKSSGLTVRVKRTTVSRGKR